MTLNQSYMTTILNSLAHEGTPAALGTLLELERQGVHLPVWIQRDVLKR